MTYMVLVNGKFMVTVDTDGSNCSAEHKILDNFSGIQGSQSFDKAAIRTEYFFDIMQGAKTLSLDELKTLSDRYDNAFKALGDAKEAESWIVDEIEELERKLEEKKAELNRAHANTRKAELETIEAKKAINFRD